MRFHISLICYLIFDYVQVLFERMKVEKPLEISDSQIQKTELTKDQEKTNVVDRSGRRVAEE